MDEAEFFYKETRDHIKHEDDLINHRMTWLVALQAFLFGAYGFSLSAEANVVAAIGKTPQDVEAVIANIARVREGFALMGIFSSLFVLVALFAASRAMQLFVRKWNQHPGASSGRFPAIIGNLDVTNSNWWGIVFGLVPALALPVSCGVVWVILERQRSAVFIAVVLIAMVTTMAALIAVGYAAGQRQNVKNVYRPPRSE